MISRDDLDPEVIGTFSNLVVWAEVEGSPSSAGALNRLAVLRAGPLVDVRENPAGKLPPLLKTGFPKNLSFLFHLFVTIF